MLLPLYFSRVAWRRGLAAVAALLVAVAVAAPQFPALSGRVVDAAGLLTPATRSDLEQQLAAHEQATSNQVVVVTLKTLDGYDIADYGVQLGRHWGIGQKDSNNGALLIVVPSERKLRIEVGYGLEGFLTDAVSSDIINNRIVPRFRDGDFDGGVRAGVEAMLAAIAGSYQPLASQSGKVDVVNLIFFIFMLGLFIYLFVNGIRGAGGSGGGSSWGGGGGYSGGSSGGGGFSGGGGSFGGGGSSGSW